MANLLSASEARVLIETTLTDTQLNAVIARVEAEITAAIGAPYTDASTTISETVRGKAKNIYLNRPILSVTTLTEYTQLSDTTGNVLTENDEFYVWHDQGRIERIYYEWDEKVTVAYVPRDDREKRKSVIIELVRIELERTTMRQESVAGEYSYTAPMNWEAERQKLMRRLMFIAV